MIGQTRRKHNKQWIESKGWAKKNKQLHTNHYTADCLPPFPRRGSRLIYSLLVVGDTLAYIWLDFPKVIANNKHGVAIKRDRSGPELTSFKLV